MPEYAWRQLESDRSRYWGVSQTLWRHGDVYRLVRKGALWDSPLDCYASHARSRFSVLLQFGNGTVICDILDQDAQRQANAKDVLPHLARHRITHQTLFEAPLEENVPLAHQSMLFRCLKRFVEFYFR